MSKSSTEKANGKINLPTIPVETKQEPLTDNGQILYKLDTDDVMEDALVEPSTKKAKKIQLMEGGLSRRDDESDEVSADEFSIEDAISGLSAIQFGKAANTVEAEIELEKTVIDVNRQTAVSQNANTHRDKAAENEPIVESKGNTNEGSLPEDVTENLDNDDPPLFGTINEIAEARKPPVAVVEFEETGDANNKALMPLAFTGEETTDIDVNRLLRPDTEKTHKSELRRLITVCAVFMGFLLVPYTTEALKGYRAWITGEPLPLIHLLEGDQTVAISQDGMLTIEENTQDSILEEEEAEPIIKRPPDDPSVTELKLVIPPIADRKPAKAEELFIPAGSMDAYFTALAMTESGAPMVTRALVWGDSTIANDGVIKNVRKRFQSQFGDGGPGFLAVQVDPKWSIRRDILRRPSAGWKTRTIVFGGAHSGRYGLAGTVSTAYGSASTRLGGVKIEGARQPLNRFQIFYETQPNGGVIKASLGETSEKISTAATKIGHGFKEMRSSDGVSEIKLITSNGRVTMYGVSMETERGSTWETFGVAGSSVRSMRNQPEDHLKAQVKARDPQLLVYWTGGNELGYPSLKSKTGRAYKNLYRRAIEKIKAGAPNASCLLIGPLDQGVRERGQIVSKKTLRKIIKFQSEVAESMGCAYWNARAAMGGEGAIKRWRNHKPTLASGDLAHLTRKGRALIGESLADSLLYAYALWKMQNPQVKWSQESDVAVTDSENEGQ